MKQSEKDFLNIIDASEEEIRQLKAKLRELQATKKAALKLQKFYYPDLKTDNNEN